MGPSEEWVGLAAPLGEVGFDGAKPTCHTDPALRRSSNPQRKRGRKTASTRGSYGDVYDLTRQNSPGSASEGRSIFRVPSGKMGRHPVLSKARPAPIEHDSTNRARLSPDPWMIGAPLSMDRVSHARLNVSEKTRLHCPVTTEHI